MNNRWAATFAVAAVMTLGLATATPTLARRHATTTGAATSTTVVVTVATPRGGIVSCRDLLVTASNDPKPIVFQPFGRTNSPCRGRFKAPLGPHAFSIIHTRTDKGVEVAADTIYATIVQGGNAELDFVYNTY